MLFALIEAFHRRSLFWPPESFTLNAQVDERVSEWLSNVLFKNEEMLKLVNESQNVNMDSLAAQITSRSSLALTKCIFEYWLFLLHKRATLQQFVCKDTAVWICKYLQLEDSFIKTMAWYENGTHATQGTQSKTSTEGISFTILPSDLHHMKREELLYWKYKLIVFASETTDEILKARATSMIYVIESKL